MAEISIILPTYNYARYLREAIDSVLAQSFRDFELIVIDDASTDDTEEIITSYNDRRVVGLRQEVNQGLVAAYNRGTELAGGWAVAFMGADDRYHPDFLKRTHTRLRSASDQVAAVGTYVRTIDSEGDPLPGHPGETEINRAVDFDDPATWIWRNSFSGYALIRRSVLDEIGPFPSDIVAAVDWNLWLRALSDGYSFDVIPEVLFDWRRHGDNITGSDPGALVQEYALISQRTLHPYLQKIGREDLLAQNVAGFLGNESVAAGDSEFVTNILSRVLVPLSPEQQAAAWRQVAQELARLRHYYVNDQPRVEYLQGRIDDLADGLRQREEVIRERDYELRAALDRLGSAEVDRRVAQNELARWQSTAVYRAARKIRDVMRK